MTDKEIIGIVEVVAAFHLIILGVFLLVKKTKSRKAFFPLGGFLIILGVHFSLLFSNIFLGIHLSSIISSTFLFMYGPLIYSFSKSYSGKKLIVKRDSIIIFLPFAYLIIWTILWQNDESFFRDRISVPIYISNFIFIGLSIRLIALSSLKRIEKHFSTFVNVCFLGMLLVYFSMSVLLEFGFSNVYLSFKLAFLAILLLLVEGLMIIFIKFPQVLVATSDLKSEIKEYEAPVYTSIEKNYDQKIITALRSFVEDNKNYKENLRLNQVSEFIGFPPYDLSKAISRQMQMNFSQYINHIRIHKSAELLKNPNCKVVEVMNQVGFNSKSRFFDVFQKEFETTPRSFQERFK